MINEFKGDYRFLSNFFMTTVVYDNAHYPSSEHAYMAAKTTDATLRMKIARCATPKEAKHMGRQIKLRAGWEDMKYSVMLEILMDKFSRNSIIRQKLIDTGDQELIEGNWWGDKVWGVCLKTNQGKNLLGKCLMQVRQSLRTPSITVVNKHHGAEGEYIGRGSPLGNPFSHMDNTKAEFKVHSRGEAVEKYEEWLNQKISSNDKIVCDELNRLVDIAYDTRELKLKCFCAPLACHGDVIKKVLDDAFKRV